MLYKPDLRTFARESLPARKNIAILGSTGSIGRSALDVIANFPDVFRVTYLSARQNIDLLKEQIQHFRPAGVVVSDDASLNILRSTSNGTTEVLPGSAITDIVRRPDVDLVLTALVGVAGLEPTLAAIDAGKDVALANKETLVAGGELVMRSVRANGTQLLPVDSEHSAILQCLRGEDSRHVERLILTASGGPFLHLEKESFDTITVRQALNHPTWKMGNKITIDSATLMNKGLEVIEAFWLFGIPPEKIDVVIHPQSIIHSMVEFADGSVKAQMGVPDMKLPIQYALMYPDRPAAAHSKLDLAVLGQLTFHKPDEEKFRCLPLAFKALAMGGTAPAVLNAANEVAVEMFMGGHISFSMIPSMVEEALLSHNPVHDATLEDILRTDRQTRERIHQMSPIT